jgi:hypothetical protein
MPELARVTYAQIGRPDTPKESHAKSRFRHNRRSESHAPIGAQHKSRRPTESHGRRETAGQKVTHLITQVTPPKVTFPYPPLKGGP